MQNKIALHQLNVSLQKILVIEAPRWSSFIYAYEIYTFWGLKRLRNQLLEERHDANL